MTFSQLGGLYAPQIGKSLPYYKDNADDSTLQNHSAKLMTLVPIVEEQGERSESVTRKTWQLSAGNSSALTQRVNTACVNCSGNVSRLEGRGGAPLWKQILVAKCSEFNQTSFHISKESWPGLVNKQ